MDFPLFLSEMGSDQAKGSSFQTIIQEMMAKEGLKPTFGPLKSAFKLMAGAV
jgi:hypothetical protein